MIGSNEERKSDKKDPVVDEFRELINSFSGRGRGKVEEDDLGGN